MELIRLATYEACIIISPFPWQHAKQRYELWAASSLFYGANGIGIMYYHGKFDACLICECPPKTKVVPHFLFSLHAGDFNESIIEDFIHRARGIVLN